MSDPTPPPAESAAKGGEDEYPDFVPGFFIFEGPSINHDADAKSGVCVICSAPTKIRCKACGVPGAPDGARSFFYCSREHQAQDWRAGHKLVCARAATSAYSGCAISIKFKDEPIFVTTKDLPAGHVLFTQIPLLVIPRAPTPTDADVFATMRSSIAHTIYKSQICTCVGCNELLLYNYIVDDPPRPEAKCKCDKCGWPVHSRLAPQDSFAPPNPCERIHAKECHLLKKHGLTWDKVGHNKHCYLLIAVIRALALSKEDRAVFWRQRRVTHMGMEGPDTAAATRDILQWLKDAGLEATRDGVFACIMRIWSSMFPMPYCPQANAKLGYVIYKGSPNTTGRILAHSCAPNTTVIFDPITMVGQFKTIRPVGKGEELCICYLDHLSDNYQPMDRRKISLDKYFLPPCVCPRCRDPETEGETYYSAIKCHRGEGHWLLRRVRPIPEQMRGGPSRFHCNKCKATKTVAEVNQLIQQLQMEFNYATACGNPNFMRSFINKYAGKTVHPNHFTLHQAWIRIGLMILNIVLAEYKKPVQEIAFDCHQKYLKDLEKVLEIMRIIHPGRVHITGEFLLAHSLLLMSELAEQVSKAGIAGSECEKLALALIDGRIGKLMEEIQVAWTIVVVDHSLIYPADKVSKKAIRTLYANHLVRALEKHIGVSELEKTASNYKRLKAEFADFEFDNTKIPVAKYNFVIPWDKLNNDDDQDEDYRLVDCN